MSLEKLGVSSKAALTLGAAAVKRKVKFRKNLGKGFSIKGEVTPKEGRAGIFFKKEF